MVDINVYWRPGCLFCSALMRRLTRSGISYEKVNIWEDERAARLVREASGGNETVPAVRIGDEFLSNPSTRQVVAAVRRIDPDVSLPADEPTILGSRRLSRWLGGSS